MKFENVKRLFESGRDVKIYLVDTELPFLFAGYVTDVHQSQRGAKSVDLAFPYVGLNVNNANRRDDQTAGIFGSADRGDLNGYCGLLVEQILDGQERVFVTQNYGTHLKSATRLVRKICHWEPPAFEEYLRRARELEPPSRRERIPA